MKSQFKGLRGRTLADLRPWWSAFLWNRFRGHATTLCGRGLARWWGVRLGRKVRFNGLPLFTRHPRSRIELGNDLTFHSHTAYNLIGINRPCIVSTLAEGAQIVIGDGCGFSGTVLGAEKSIRLGKNVRCGANTLITDTDWHTDDPRTTPPQPVVIEDNVWLGVNVTVLKGVTIGANSLIGAGSLVTRSIPANVVAAGSPAKVLRHLDKATT